jgi:hypothetical protein
MDRLELYYSSPSPKQRRGDYIRIRNVYVRSTRSYEATRFRTKGQGAKGKGAKGDTGNDHRMCREIDLTDKLLVGTDRAPTGFFASLITATVSELLIASLITAPVSELLIASLITAPVSDLLIASLITAPVSLPTGISYQADDY